MYTEQEFFQELAKIRQFLHQYPELSEYEHQKTAFIRQYLSEHGITILKTNLETGIIAEIGEQEGKIIGLRADIDALPIQEVTDLPFSSVNDGVMHACGHDFHTASLLGAAFLLKEQEKNLPGKVRLVFQPAEEIFQGAKKVIEAVDFSKWDALVGFHNAPNLPLGTIGFRQSKQMASVDRFQVKIQGVGSHAAHPDQGNDPIVTGSQIISNLQAIIPRHIPASEQAILSITHVEAGNTWNVLPDSYLFEGTIRTFDDAIRQKIIQQFKKTIYNLTDIYQQTAEIEWITGPGPVNNDPELFTSLSHAFDEIAEDLIQLPSNLGGEDFAFYQEKVPIFFASIGTGTGIPLHHPAFLIDDDALVYSVNYYLKAVETLLTVPTSP